MVKISESVIKAVIVSKRKWLPRLNQKVAEAGTAPDSCAVVTHKLPGRKQAPNPTYFVTRNVETPYCSPRGKQSAKSAYGSAGLGSRKKRKPDGNGLDTGCNITRHESEPTSDRSCLARELAESW